MNEPQLVADCVKACGTRPLPSPSSTVSASTRVEADFVRDFGTVAAAGCEVFIVHARNAWLRGLSPKENREIPPLRCELVAQLSATSRSSPSPSTAGSKTPDQIEAQLAVVDGVMIGREAYHEPWSMAQWDSRFFGQQSPAIRPASRSREAWLAIWTACTPAGGHVPRHAPRAGPLERHARAAAGARSGATIAKTLAPREVARMATEARLGAVVRQAA